MSEFESLSNDVILDQAKNATSGIKNDISHYYPFHVGNLPLYKATQDELQLIRLLPKLKRDNNMTAWGFNLWMYRLSEKWYVDTNLWDKSIASVFREFCSKQKRLNPATENKVSFRYLIFLLDGNEKDKEKQLKVWLMPKTIIVDLKNLMVVKGENRNITEDLFTLQKGKSISFTLRGMAYKDIRINGIAPVKEGWASKIPLVKDIIKVPTIKEANEIVEEAKIFGSNGIVDNNAISNSNKKEPIRGSDFDDDGFGNNEVSDSETADDIPF